MTTIDIDIPNFVWTNVSIYALQLRFLNLTLQQSFVASDKKRNKSEREDRAEREQ